MLGGISIWQLLIVLVIVIMIFGTKKLRNLGGDLGGAVKGFKKALKDGEEEQHQKQETDKLEQDSKDAQFTENSSEEATKKEKDKS